MQPIEAGRQTDVLVGISLLGLILAEVDDKLVWARREFRSDGKRILACEPTTDGQQSEIAAHEDHLPKFSADICAAMWILNEHPEWRVVPTRDGHEVRVRETGQRVAVADTPALALCRAQLAVKPKAAQLRTW